MENLRGIDGLQALIETVRRVPESTWISVAAIAVTMFSTLPRGDDSPTPTTETASITAAETPGEPALIEDGGDVSPPAPPRDAPSQDGLTNEPAMQLAAKEYCDQARAYFQQGEFTKAVAAFSQAIAVVPVGESFGERAIARLFAGDYSGAVVDASTMIRLNPRHATGYRVRATAYEKLGDHWSAARDRDTASALQGLLSPSPGRGAVVP